MLPEISLNVLDIAENSIKAGADLVEIDVSRDTAASLLTVSIRDDGCGMSAEQVQQVVDPFYTSRSTRKVGLGIPFFKMEAELTGGSLTIDSTPGRGTAVTAVFHTDSIDCMPLGNIGDTIFSLVLLNESLHFVYRYRVDGAEFTLDTDALHEAIGPELSFGEPEISAFIRSYIQENTAEADAAAIDRKD